MSGSARTMDKEPRNFEMMFTLDTGRKIKWRHLTSEEYRQAMGVWQQVVNDGGEGVPSVLARFADYGPTTVRSDKSHERLIEQAVRLDRVVDIDVYEVKR